MIPKIIHYSWFSDEPFPEIIRSYIETWKKYLGDYKFVLWDAEALAKVNSTFANEAVSVGKWAFAADFIRLYAVYNYGGIWLDTDIELFGSFDSFLGHRMFIGAEFTHHDVPLKKVLGSHCFGAEAGHPFLKDCLEYYNGRHFINCQSERIPIHMRFDMTLLPIIQANIAIEHYGFNAEYLTPDVEQVLDEDIHVYPSYYFDRPNFSSMKDVVCIHKCFGTWLSDKGTYDDTKYLYIYPKGVKYIILKIERGIRTFLYNRFNVSFLRRKTRYIHDDMF